MSAEEVWVNIKVMAETFNDFPGQILDDKQPESNGGLGRLSTFASCTRSLEGIPKLLWSRVIINRFHSPVGQIF